MTKRAKINFILNTLFYSLVFFLLYFAGKFLLAYLFPVIIGIIITVLVQRPSKKISELTHIQKRYCALILVILTYASIIAFIGFGLYKSVIYLSEAFGANSVIIKELSKAISEFSEVIEQFSINMPKGARDFINSITIGLSEGISSYVSKLAKDTAASFPMFFTGSVVTIIASCYIARDFDGFKESLKSILSYNILKAYRLTADLFKDNVFKIIIGYLKLLVITFAELLIGFLILGIDYAVILSFIIAFLDMLPVIGTGTVLVPWSIYALISGDLNTGIGLIILYLTITILRNIIEPKIIGKQMGLHPLIALISVFIGLKLMGFIGIFLLPLTIMLIYKMYDKGVFDILFSSNKIREAKLP